MLDPQVIRRDFPILSRLIRGKPLIYLDNAATSQKPLSVIQALESYYRQMNANIHRGIHVLSEEATAAYEEVRQKVAHFIGARSPQEIIFTRNATEAINLAAHGWGRKYLQSGDEILLSEMEHHSNLVPWQLLAQERKAQLTFIPLTSDGQLDLAHLPKLLTPRTKLLSVTLMSNVLGTINPVKEIIRQAHAAGVTVCIDGAQGVPHLPVNVQELDCDFLAFSSHKMLGPTGVGVLYGKFNLLQGMNPFNSGGNMIREVWYDHATWNEVPWKFEAGTPNIADVIAFGAAIDYLERLGMDAVRLHEQEIAGYALEVLGKVSDLVVYGPRDPAKRGAAIAFNYRDIHPHDIGQVLDDEGIAIRAGHHCCQPLMRKLGVSAMARASFYVYNTREEADLLAKAITRAKEVFSGVPHR